MNRPLVDRLRRYRPDDAAEAADVDRTIEFAADCADPWDRASPLHVTASALIVHPPSQRVLLRWHERQQGWLQVGGHGDPGELDPLDVALREGAEETGIDDLRPWPTDELRHVTIVPVPPGKGEPAHHHADVRFLLATDHPERATPEKPTALLRWETVDDALDLVGTDNVATLIRRAATLLRTANA